MKTSTAGLLTGSFVAMVALTVGLVCGDKIGTRRQYEKDRIAAVRMCDTVANAYKLASHTPIAKKKRCRENCVELASISAEAVPCKLGSRQINCINVELH